MSLLFLFSYLQPNQHIIILDFLKPFTFLTNRTVKAAWNYFLRQSLLSEHKRQELQHLVVSETRMGVTTQSIADAEVIVSLTSHSFRLYEACLSIESIMQGTILPNRIILWIDQHLSEEDIPQSLRLQQHRGLEIRRTTDQGAYTKLLPSVKSYPKSIIVTIDDDIYYPFDMLECLLAEHRRDTQAICANFCKKFQANRQNSGLSSFLKWPLATKAVELGARYYFEGFGGVLYPPHCFSDELFNESVFQQCCPYADDVWYNVMAIRDGLRVRFADTHYARFPYLDNDYAQRIGLKLINDNPKDCQNDVQLQKTLQHYGLSYRSCL